MNQRFRNYGFWIAVGAFVIKMAAAKYNINVGEWTDFLNGFLDILVLAGILSNPTTENKGFLDDKK